MPKLSYQTQSLEATHNTLNKTFFSLVRHYIICLINVSCKIPQKILQMCSNKYCPINICYSKNDRCKLDLTKRCESKQNRRKIYFFVNNFVSDIQPTSCVIILELFPEKLLWSTQPQEIQMTLPRRQLTN